MTLHAHRTEPGSDSASADRPRLRTASGSRHVAAVVDGAWWPYSDDLVAELTQLLPVLTGRLGPIHRIIYHLDEWGAAPGKAAIADERVRLDGYRYRPTGTIDVLPLDGAALTLLIVPPHSSADAAETAMAAAVDLDNASTVDGLLAGTGSDGVATGHVLDATAFGRAEQRWESEGGAGTY